MIANIIISEEAYALSISDDIWHAAECWNNAGANVQINVFNYNSTQISPADITITISTEQSDKDRIAHTQPLYNGQQITQMSQYDLDWDSYISIKLNVTQGKFLQIDSNRQARTIIHEVGHALKLCHPCDVITDYHPNAVMCQTACSSPQKVNHNELVLRLSGHDKAVIISKWGIGG